MRRGRVGLDALEREAGRERHVDPRFAHARHARSAAITQPIAIARARANLTCTRPSLTVNYGQLGGDAGARDRLRALVTALRDNYPAVLGAAGEVGEAVVNLVESFFSALDGFTDSLTAAIDAFACGLKAFEVSAQVSLTFSASFDATASITGAVAVEGSAM